MPDKTRAMANQVGHECPTYGCQLKQAFLPSVCFGIPQHISAHKVEEIFTDFKMAVSQPRGIFFPFGMRADNSYRAFAPDFGIGNIAAERDKGCAHLKRVGLTIGKLPECGEGLQFVVAVQADFRAVVEQLVTAFHAVERRGFAVAYLAESACHAAQDVLFGNRAYPVFHGCPFSDGFR